MVLDEVREESHASLVQKHGRYARHKKDDPAFQQIHFQDLEHVHAANDRLPVTTIKISASCMIDTKCIYLNITCEFQFPPKGGQ